MPNSGPPYYATNAAEAARAQAHQVSARRRAAFAASLQARLRGSAAAAKSLKDNWMPVTQRKDNT